MFVQAFEQISKKLAKSTKKDQGYTILEKKIMDSPVLKSHFEIYNDLKEKTNTIGTSSQFKSFFSTLTEKVNKIDIKEVNKEVKALLEYFNINPTSIKETTMDKAMSLNEFAIRKVVINEKLNILSETFKHIIKEENEYDLRRNFQIVNFLSESFSDKTRKTFFKESLRSLLEERYKDYGSCVKKLYKLRILAEEVLREDDFENDEEGEEEEKAKLGGTKTAKLTDLSYLKKPTVEIVNWKQPSKVVINFNIPIYPTGAVQTATQTTNLKTRTVVQRLERHFVNLTIYQKNRTNLFNPVGTIWDVGNLHSQPKVGAENKVSVSIYLNTNSENDGVNTMEMFVKAVNQMLIEFNDMLPDLMGPFARVLTSDAQKQDIKSTKGLDKRQKIDLANRHGEIDRNLIKRKKGGLDIDDESDIIDDFGDMF
ncbi:MAG: hypothetical protein ABIP51_01255 [Bacteroidia bacterium]